LTSACFNTYVISEQEVGKPFRHADYQNDKINA